MCPFLASNNKGNARLCHREILGYGGLRFPACSACSDCQELHEIQREWYYLNQTLPCSLQQVVLRSPSRFSRSDGLRFCDSVIIEKRVIGGNQNDKPILRYGPERPNRKPPVENPLSRTCVEGQEVSRCFISSSDGGCAVLLRRIPVGD